MANIYQIDNLAFAKLCKNILRGLGLNKSREFEAKNVELGFRAEVVRQSNDGMFKAVETSLCLFIRKPVMGSQNIQYLTDAAVAADVGCLFVVVFGETTSDAETKLRAALKDENIRVVLLASPLAEALAASYNPRLKGVAASSKGFSFLHLRQHAQLQVQEAAWHEHFQTLSLLPTRLSPLHAEDIALMEADLFRAAMGGSYLLLGEPGAGKTTSLKALAGAMAHAGCLTPVFVPAGGYKGNFLDLLGETLSPGGQAVAEATVRTLLESGALTVLLDGLNEVQDRDLHAQLVEEINQLTAPNHPASRSLWIVSGRVHDYEQSYRRLKHLEQRRWEMQPLTADLIFRFLAEALGKATATSVYDRLGPEMRSICSNPLLLTMVVTLHKETGDIPTSRGSLYQRFIDLLMDWGNDRAQMKAKRSELAALMPDGLEDDNYRILAHEALVALADAMSTTMLAWGEASSHFAATLASSVRPVKAADLLLEDVISHGILRQDYSHRVSFFHHTFQEYFKAFRLLNLPPEELIPSSGIEPEQREVVVFVAGLLQNPAALIERALQVENDALLAFELLRDAQEKVTSKVVMNVASQLWQQTLRLSKRSFIGANRRKAQAFQHLAEQMKVSVEELAKSLNGHLDEIAFANCLMQFYADLGDAEAQNRALAKVKTGSKVPEALLFQAAVAASDSGDHRRAITLYTRFLEKNPDSAAALNNRGSVYAAVGQKNKALADARRAVELEDDVLLRANLARRLYDSGKKDEALYNITIAIEYGPDDAASHATLGTWLKSEDPERASHHLEQAVRNAPHDDALRDYYSQLAELQTQLGHYAASIRSLREMIALSPTSPQVNSWKEQIATLRQDLDAEERKRSARLRLQEHGQLPLPTLAHEWLRAAGFEVTSPTSMWLSGQAEHGTVNQLSIVLMPEPSLTAAALSEALSTMPRELQKTKQIIVLAAAEILSAEAHHQLAALQEKRTVALVNTVEVRDALLQSDRACRSLLDNVLRRATPTADPFTYKGIVREKFEFFGRTAVLDEMVALVGHGQQVGLYGIHKVGKSSLLEQLRKNYT